MIYILEGPDGVGKSTLAQEIYKETKGHILHCTWKSTFNMLDYFVAVMKAASELSEYQDVIIDRWAPSEQVYGDVFRGGPSFNVGLLLAIHSKRDDIKWIYCRNDNAVENHMKNREEREEMFEDMTEIVKRFDEFVKESKLPWIEYDYDKVDMHKFVEELVNESQFS